MRYRGVLFPRHKRAWPLPRMRESIHYWRSSFDAGNLIEDSRSNNCMGRRVLGREESDFASAMAPAARGAALHRRR